MSGLIDALRDLAAMKHDDFSIGSEAADALESMQSDIATLEQENRQMRARMDRLASENHQMREAIVLCAAKFREYALIHAAKPDQDKADRNEAMAKMAEAAMAKGE